MCQSDYNQHSKSNLQVSNKRKTIHSYLFLPKEYSGDPYTSVFTPHTEAEVLAFLETGWGLAMWKTCSYYFYMATIDISFIFPSFLFF